MHSAPEHTPLPIAFWAERRPDGTVAVESRPASLGRTTRTPSDLPVLANDARAALASGAVPATLAPSLLDIRELFSLTHPVSTADEAPAILGEMLGDGAAATGAEALARAWPAALARFPKVFSPVYVAMIRAGEASGAMDDVLRRLIEQDERVQGMKSRIRSAMQDASAEGPSSPSSLLSAMRSSVV